MNNNGFFSQPQPMSGSMVVPKDPEPELITPKKDHSRLVLIILLVVFVIGTMVLAGLATYLYIEKNEAENNLDAKINTAVASAIATQIAADDKNCEAKLKESKTYFVGPADYGSLSFEYPKVWSVYIAADASDGKDFEAYVNPDHVPSTANKDNIYLLRIKITNTTFDKTAEEYAKFVEKGTMTVENRTVNGHNLSIYKGELKESTSKEKRTGYVTLIKIRDKTAILQTDSLDFVDDYNSILNTITFNS